MSSSFASALICLAVVASLTLAGCGKKGRLYLPPEEDAAAIAAPVPASSEPG